jgi:hypothetical protein
MVNKTMELIFQKYRMFVAIIAGWYIAVISYFFIHVHTHLPLFTHGNDGGRIFSNCYEFYLIIPLVVMAIFCISGFVTSLIALRNELKASIMTGILIISTLIVYKSPGPYNDYYTIADIYIWIDGLFVILMAALITRRVRIKKRMGSHA